MEKEKKDIKKGSMHIAAFVLGIVSIITSFFWYVSMPSGILAIVFGAKAAKKTGSKLAKAGLITGIIGLSLFLLIYIGLTLALIASNI